MLKLINFNRNIFSKIKDIQYQLEITRNVRMRKPPWVPRSKEKQYRVPPLYLQDLEERNYMTAIWQNYKAKMRSMYLLFKTEGKFSDKESLVAQERKKIEIKKEIELLKKNDTMNKEILKFQLIDEGKKLEELKYDAEIKYNQQLERENIFQLIADQKVKKLKEESKNFIKKNNLEYEIEKMLNERIDYNFSVDLKGNFYKSKKLIKVAFSDLGAQIQIE
jgi:hypothetical protein